MTTCLKHSLSRRHLLSYAVVTVGCLTMKVGRSRSEDVEAAGFELDPTWPAEYPGPLQEPCQVAGVAVDGDGRILVLNRGENHWMPGTGFRQERIQKPAVLVFDSQTGRVVDSWGEDLFVMPHQISVDRSGHIWIVDCGQDKVFKFDPAGTLLMQVGGAEIGFRKPTDAVVFRDGSFAISDGYTNSRVAVFNADGRLIHAWGQKGKGSLEFQTPHSIACDEDELIYIADRENHRVQILTRKGEVHSVWTHVERPLTIRYAAGSIYVLSNLDADKGIVRQFDRNGELLTSFRTRPSGSSEDYEWPHGLAVNDDGSQVYVGFTLTGRRVHRYRRLS
jgi:peptidylamidoglycolate lyase